MKKIDLNKLNQLIEDYPFLYIPYLIKISINKSEFNNNLNSLALRHPNRIFLKNFIDENDLKSDFIDDFIRKNEDLASKRLSQKEFITENMAKIYIKQNKIKKAIKIYEKLISLNSKKKTYFAKKIKNLKN